MATTPRKSNVAFELLASHHGLDFAASYYRDKIVQRPLYLKPTPIDGTKPVELTKREIRLKAREAAQVCKRRSPGKPKPLSAKQKRALQVYAIPLDQQKYEIYRPLHRLWCSYMREILSLEEDKGHGLFIEAKGAGPLLASADYHGALVEVVRSRCPSRVGLKGIVVRDTRSTFEIVTARNQLKVMPKEHTVFRFEIALQEDLDTGTIPTSDTKAGTPVLKPLVLELHGSSFEHRAPDRATRKFVLHMLDL